MISISPADTVIIIGVIQGLAGMFTPAKLLAWQRLNATSLTVTGAFLGFVGLVLKVVLG